MADGIGEYEAWKRSKERTNANAAASVVGATQEQPDQVAGDIRLATDFAKVTGQPVPPRPLVGEYRNEFQSKIDEAKNTTILSSSPRLAEWLRNPDNAAVAKDDLEGLSWWETGLGAANNALKRGLLVVPQASNQFLADTAAQRAGDANKGFGEIFSDQRQGPALTRSISLPSDLYMSAWRYGLSRIAPVIGGDQMAAAEAFQQRAGEVAKRQAAIPYSPAGARRAEALRGAEGKPWQEQLRKFAEDSAADPGGTMAFLAETAVQSLPMMGAAVGATVLTKSPAIGAGVMGATSYAQERGTGTVDFLREKGIDVSTPDGARAALSDPALMSEAAQRGHLRGLVIGAMDGLSGGLAGKTLAKNPAVNMALQAVSQAVMGAAGEAGGQYVSGQDLNLSDIIIEGLAEFATAPVEVGAAGIAKLRERRAEAKAAGDRVALFQELSGQSANSKLRERLPDAFRNFVEQATADGPVENVYVPADQFVKYFQGQGVDPFELVDTLEGMTRDDLDAAIAGGGDVKIPTATYAARVAGSPHDAFLMQNMRFSPDEMTATEAAEFNAKAEEIAQEMWDEAERQRLEDEAGRTFEQEIYDTMVSRLREAGRSTDVATNEATIYAAFYRVMAARNGMTTEEMLRAYPLPQVQGSLPQGMQFKSIDDLTRAVANARAVRPTVKRGPSLLEFISERGGISDTGGELRARDAEVVKRGKGKKALRLARTSAGDFDTTGRKYGADEVARAVVEAGYLADNPTVMEYKAAMADGRETPDLTRALWDAIDEELRGRSQYVADQNADAEASKQAALDEIEAYLNEIGVGLDSTDAEIRAAYEASRQYAQGGPENLLVQHNLSADNLIHADKMRGIAVPSIAVSRVEHPLDGFGEITLLGAPSMIDPKADKTAKTFDADVYSPRYPVVRYKVSSRARSSMWKRLGGVSEELGRVLSAELDDGEIERNGMKAVYDSSAVQLEYLREKGIPVELPKVQPKSDWAVAVPELMDALRGESYGTTRILSDPVKRAAIEKAIANDIENVKATAPDLTDEDLRSMYFTHSGEPRSSIVDQMVEEVRARDNPGVDRRAATYAVRDAAKPYVEDIRQWADQKFGDVVSGEVVQTETRGGDWKYLPHTLDNVVKIMKQKLRDGEGFNYGVGSIRSTVANQFKSMDAIKKARGRIIPADAMDAAKNEINDEFMALASRFGEYAGSVGKGFGWLDTFSEHLKELAGGGRINQYYDGLPSEMVGEARSFLSKLSNMPTAYFEAKLQRAVELREFKVAVIPNDTPKAARDALMFSRVKTYEYDRSTPGAREAVIAAASRENGILFQNTGGPRGSIQFGANGEAIMRLFERADLSTVLHESGHFFLSVVQDMAAKGEANASADISVVREWWKSNAADVVKDARKAMPDAVVTIDDVNAYLDTGSTGDVMKDAAIDVGTQEQWARALETYFMEGKAPSIELRSAFEKFRAWLLAIYRKFAGLDVKVNDELRSVFDRMLATDEEIAAAKSKVGSDSPIFTSAEAMGLSAEEFDRFTKLRAKAEDDAKAKLLGEIMKPLARQREAWFKEERAKVREQVERDVNAMPVFRALEWLGNKRWLGDEEVIIPDARLSKSVLTERYGDGVLKLLPRGQQTVYAVEGGVDPDIAAGWFGFGSGDELVRALETAPRRLDAIEAETDKLMNERHGDVLRDGTVEEAALAAVHGDRKGEWIAAELKAISDVAGLPKPMTAKEARATARTTLARTRVRDAMNAGRYLAAERKAADEAARLGATLAREKLWMEAARRRIETTARGAAKGKVDPNAVAPAIDAFNAKLETTTTSYEAKPYSYTDQSGKVRNVPGGPRTVTNLGYNDLVAKLADAKRRQLLNHSLYSEARKIADEVEKAENYIVRLNKASTRERIAGAGRRANAQVDYLAAIDEILDRYDFRRISGAAEARRGALAAFIDRMKEAGRENELAIPDAVLADVGRKPYKTVPVEELRGAIDSLKNLEHIAKRWDDLIDAVNKRKLDEAADAVVGAFEANLKRREPGRVATIGEARRKSVRAFLDLVLNTNTILREVDGFADQGAAWTNIKAPIDEANNRLIKRKNKAATDLEALYSEYSKADRRRMSVRTFIPELNMSISKWEMISIALNTGNEGNYQRITDKRVRGSFTPDQVGYVLSRLDERDARFVQGVWDYLDTFRADIAARERRATGVEPKWVEAKPITIAGVDLKGGYYPIKYDGRLGGLASDFEAQDISQALMAGKFGKAQTRNGHLKQRGAAAVGSVDLDPMTFHRHVNQVIYDLEMSEPIANSWRLIHDNRVKTAFIDHGRSAEFDALEIWLKDVAEGDLKSADLIGRTAQEFKSNFTAAKLAFNLSNTIAQVAGLAQSIVVVGKKDFAIGVKRAFRNGIREEIAAKSAFMSERQTTFNKDVYDFASDPKLGPLASSWGDFKKDWIAPMSFYLMTKVQWHLVDVPTWLAGYNQGLRQFDGDEAKAITHADNVVKRAQASGLFVDRSSIERGSLSMKSRQQGVTKLFTTLASYMFAKFNLAYERSARAGRVFGEEGVSLQSFKEAMSYTMDMVFLFMVDVVIMAAIRGKLPSQDDDNEDEAAAWAKFLAKETAFSALGTVPFVRDAASLLDGFDAGGAYGAVMGDLVAKPMKQIMQGEVDAALVKSIVNAAGLVSGAPALQINRGIDAAWRQAEGEDVSPIEYLLGRMGNAKK